MVVGEQPYKSRDLVGSDSGLGHLHVNLIGVEENGPEEKLSQLVAKVDRL